MYYTLKLLVVALGLMGVTATAQETSTSHSDSKTPQMAPGQSMMGQGDMPGMMQMMQQMGPMMEQCSEMMAAMANQMPSAPSAPGSPDDNG